MTKKMKNIQLLFVFSIFFGEDEIMAKIIK